MGTLAMKAVFGMAAVDGSRISEEATLGQMTLIPVPQYISNPPGPLVFCKKFGSGLQTGNACPDIYIECNFHSPFLAPAAGWHCYGSE